MENNLREYLKITNTSYILFFQINSIINYNYLLITEFTKRKMNNFFDAKMKFIYAVYEITVNIPLAFFFLLCSYFFQFFGFWFSVFFLVQEEEANSLLGTKYLNLLSTNFEYQFAIILGITKKKINQTTLTFIIYNK